MGLPVEVNPLFLENQYAIQRSLRFRSSATAYLNRTIGTPTGSTTWTWSAWIKRGTITSSAYQYLFSYDGSNSRGIAIASSADTYPDAIYVYNGTSQIYGTTPVRLRDPSSWYHITLSCSSGTASLYLNGNSTAILSASSMPAMSNGMAMNIGRLSNGGSFYFDGYLAEVNFIDGQALTPSSFGQYNEFGVWSPRKYGGSYGTNGFYLPFTDTSALTSSLTGNVGLGRDFSGNSNYWITNNISIAGSSYTSYTSGSGTYTVPAGITSINYLVVGGGGGGAYFGGGGGGGGVLAGQLSVTPGQTISYSVGGGGNGSTSNGTDGTNGTSSTFGSVTALGGGGGGSNTNNGVAGGSGGGGSRSGTGGAGTTGQGFVGGNGTTNGSTYFNAGGGGGATAVGGNAIAVAGNTQGGGTGGAGYTWINGSVYGGGGGGGGYGANGGPGGSGGGGSGGGDFNTNTAGTANTGGGGGGGKSGGSGSNGGSGIIIISIGGSTTYDAMTDVPPPSTIQNVAAGNYCIINPLSQRNSSTVANGNLTGTLTAYTGAPNLYGSLSVSSGKYYWEVTYTSRSGNNALAIGIVNNNAGMPLVDMASGSAGVWYYSVDGNKRVNGSATAYGATYDTGAVIGIALDVDNAQITFYKNNASQGAFSIPSSGTWTPGCWNGTSSGNQVFDANFGQRPFSYTPPSGFLPLNSNNLPAPTIPNGAKVMAATLYTGTGSTNPIYNSANNTLGVTFKPDFVWIRNRPDASGGMWLDSVRGTSVFLQTTNANGDATNTGDFVSFNNDGFTVGGNGNLANLSTKGFVGWNWNAGSGSSTVPSGGTITPTGASINVSAGFSIIKYTGTGVAGTLPHGLGAAPSMVITKKTSTSGDEWVIWHTSLSGGNFILLFTNAAQFASTQYTAIPTSLYLNLNTATAVNNNGSSYISYIWAPISGYSSFGSYTGNGSADGPMIFTNMRPRWVMVKRTDALEGWEILDTSRNTYNAVNSLLEANTVNAEITNTSRDTDYLSNGFKVRNSSNAMNASGGTYIYAAFAENPFKLALAR